MRNNMQPRQKGNVKKRSGSSPGICAGVSA